MSNQDVPISPRVIMGMLFFIVVIPLLPLLISRRWDWWEAWAYAILYILSFALSRVLGRMLSLYAQSPAYRRFVQGIRASGVMPENLEEYFGYGLFVGQKP